MKNSDLKIVSFTEKWNMPCTYFVKEGVPEAKKLTVVVIKLMPGGKEIIIASKVINLSLHFGEEYHEATVEMDVNGKKADGTLIRSLTYQAIISCRGDKDREMFNQCIHWSSLNQEYEKNY